MNQIPGQGYGGSKSYTRNPLNFTSVGQHLSKDQFTERLNDDYLMISESDQLSREAIR